MTLDFEEVRRLLEKLREARMEEIPDEIDLDGVEQYGEWDGVGRDFKTFRDYQRWAFEICRNRVIAAVDGGQINPDRTLYPPIGLVQSAAFVNFHDGRYEKLHEIELVIPESEHSRFEELTSLRRFSLECRMIKRVMESFGDEKLYILYDGSLIASFLGELSSEVREEYLKNLNEVLRLSEELRIPLIGYVDLSYARDLLSEVENLRGGKFRGFDAEVLKGRLENWGDCTPVFVAKRDITKKYDVKICYSYFLKSKKALPSRIEFPFWMRDMKREIVNVVLSQCILGGGGYPYVLESADKLAHIGRRDRERFKTMVMKYLSGFPSFKSESKSLRRR
ncbi:MAG: DNA double-strand break repair nuclease NurA [Archaeoglobi archaeon]|nr:DNA double-strand break repair nuclease NurA [Candidatus Mnemosynella bozhongmuii]